jgi:hypothetical protein
MVESQGALFFALMAGPSCRAVSRLLTVMVGEGRPSKSRPELKKDVDARNKSEHDDKKEGPSRDTLWLH